MTEPFISINELSKRLAVPAHTLRYWEKAFSGAIRPITGAGGRRYYRDEDVIKIETIRGLLYDRGYTIAGVKKLLAEGELKPEGRKPRAPDKKSDVDVALDLLAKARAVLEE
ncbi:MAG: MerR family transcriptional regulator [Alphaproteobacteria bacterium]|nr:MerR family transcriptional regulator [Alphaproteobacteria bacterium]MCL2758385.1 MerR family transcriptional regulator [Alphaproteobacteria bacterium]